MGNMLSQSSNEECTISSEIQFINACSYGRVHEVEKLLKASQVDVNKPYNGATPFYIACDQGHTGIIKQFFIAHFKQDPTLFNKEADNEIIQSIIEKYSSSDDINLDPLEKVGKFTQYISQARKIAQQECAADVFALTVFFCDGYLTSEKSKDESDAKKVKFFQILSQLPLDEQERVCLRLFVTAGIMIPKSKKEESFKAMTYRFYSMCHNPSSSDEKEKSKQQNKPF